MKKKICPDIFLVQLFIAPIKSVVYKTLNVLAKEFPGKPEAPFYTNNLTFSGSERLIALVPDFYNFFNPLTAA